MEKIISEDQIVQIKKNDSIKKYPNDSLPTDTLELANFMNSTDFIVDAVFSADFYNPEFHLRTFIPPNDNIKLGPGTAMPTIGILKKNGNSLIDEQVWWWLPNDSE